MLELEEARRHGAQRRDERQQQQEHDHHGRRDVKVGRTHRAELYIDVERHGGLDVARDGSNHEAERQEL